MNHLPKLGFTNMVRADGAFYIYSDITEFNTTSDILAKDILIKTGVAITPDLDFERVRSQSAVRFSFACSSNEVVEAIDRLINWYLSYEKPSLKSPLFLFCSTNLVFLKAI